MSQTHSRIFGNRFQARRKISAGSFGVVFLVLDLQTNQECALKLEKEDGEEMRSVEKEIIILEKLQNTLGVPKMIWHGVDGHCNMLAMQLLGRDLSHFFRSHRKFSIKCGVQLAYEAVQILRNIHQDGVVHRDLKPENMLMSKTNDQLYIVDFGISKIYFQHGEHMPYRNDKTFMGTTRYASLAAHLGSEISRKDDLESLFYVMVYLLKGNLPWQNMPVQDNERTKAVGEMKRNMDPNDLCISLPHEFVQIFQYLKQVQFKEEPDYNYILGLLSTIADQNQFMLDGTYDWTEGLKLVLQQQSLDSKISDNKMQKELSPRQLLKSNSSKMSNQVIWQVNEPMSYQKQQSQLGLLAIPDPHKKPGESSNLRSENRHFSNSSSHTNNMGSYSSMQIKYMPSIADAIKPPLMNTQRPVHPPESLYDKNMDENFEDIELHRKFLASHLEYHFTNKFKEIS